MRSEVRNWILIILSMLFGIGAVAASLLQLEITSGAAELTRWSTVVISNKTVAFFFNLIAIGFMGGYISSKFKSKKRKLAILVATQSLVYLVGYITAKSNWLQGG